MMVKAFKAGRENIFLFLTNKYKLKIHNKIMAKIKVKEVYKAIADMTEINATSLKLTAFPLMALSTTKA